MKVDFDVATRTVSIALWDTSFSYSGPPIPLHDMKAALANLSAQTARGELFYLYTGINQSFPVSVYVDEAVPPQTLARYVAHKEAFLLKCPRGLLALGDLVNFRDQAEWLREAKTT